MIQLFDFLQQLFAPKGDAVTAFIQFLPAILSAGSAIYGAVSEGQMRKKMARERQKWNAENEALFNQDYYSDYTQRADAQNIIRQMRDDTQRQQKYDENKAAITGSTPEYTAAVKEARSKAMSNLYRNLGAQGAQFKERAKDRYLRQKQALQGMEYDDMSSSAESSANLMSNGLSGLAGQDWAGILGGGTAKPNNKYSPGKLKQGNIPLLNVNEPANIPTTFDWSKLPK